MAYLSIDGLRGALRLDARGRYMRITECAARSAPRDPKSSRRKEDKGRARRNFVARSCVRDADIALTMGGKRGENKCQIPFRTYGPS